MAAKPDTEKSQPVTAQFDAMADLQKEGMGNMLGLGAAWMETLTAMNAEVANFVADRIQQDVKTQHEILNCRDFNRLQHIQARFMQDAIEQYQAETGKLVEMGTKAFATNLKNEQTPDS